MTTGAQQESRTDLPLPEQDFVDAAYERLDALRASYRDRQGRIHSTHGVGNAQAWTEREALSAHLGEMAARLEGVEERLVFGRLDMVDSSTRHVGRLSLSHEDGTPLLVDWRAPAARPFYQATSAKPEGVVRRRHISTRDRRVTGLEDELLDASHAQGLELQGEGALMHALSEARDGRMGDIVATIQSEQDRIIRASDKGLLVVQGGPGTGKTAVALHRIAYLLYAHRERLERSGVLLVGPSRLFLRYIEQVLPSLGETGVVSVTMGDLVPGVRARAFEDEAVARIKGLPAWAALVKEAVRALAKLPKGDQQLQLDTAMWDTAQAKDKMDAWLSGPNANKIEVVIANNDAMAMGAVEALKAHNKSSIPVFGVDALPEALALVKSGGMAGTVLNDANNQAKATFELAKNLADGKDAAAGTNWKIDNKIVRVPYVGVDKDNLSQFAGK